MIKQILNELFYDTLNIDFNLAMWVRNLCKYGDFFLFNDIHPEFGVVNVFPIPIAEMEREEDLLQPSEKDSTELGEVPQETTKGSMQPYYPGYSYGLAGIYRYE